FLAGAVVEKGTLRNLLLRNLGDGKFADVASKMGLASAPPCLGCCVGDFDNDGFPDLLLTTTKGVRLLRNRGKEGDALGFDDVTQAAGLGENTDVCLGAAWVDLDSDGDLDLVVARYATNEASALKRLSGKKTEPLGLGVYLNVGKSAAGPVGAIQRLSAEFRRTEQPKELVSTDGPALHIAVGDFNGDRSPDLIVVQEGAAPKHRTNERLLRFRSQMLPEKLIPNASWNGALVLDSDNRERSDLFFVGNDRPPVLIKSNGLGQETAFEAGATNSPPLMQAIALDVDLDGWTDILGVSPSGEAIFLHNKQGSLLATPSLFAPLAGQVKGVHAIASLDADGDFRPDVAVWSKTSGLAILRNAGNGNHGVSISLNGRREKKEKLRCNADAFGSRLTVHAETLTSSMERSTASAGLGQSSQPALIGIGKRKLADVLRLRWPDGTWQAELSVPGNQTNRISQTDRTPDSCPLLFAWDGEKYGFVADFLGAGTLGEYLPDGSCRQPRPEESVKIESHQLQPRNGKLKLKLTEPMDEVTYLDKVRLVAVDHPADMHVYPDERFSEALPSQDLHAFRRLIRPVRATDHRGANVLPELSRRDRTYFDGFKRQSWLGYAEDHHVDLDFGETLQGIKSAERLFLCIYGWTDYAYPEAIWAATQAGVPLTEPILEERVDGEWKKVDVEVGFPAGRPRMTLVELTGKRRGSGPFRLRTNMQVFWDEIYLAVGEASIPAKDMERPGSAKTEGFRVTVMAPSQAELRAGGGCTEWSPDGKQPTIFSDGPAAPVPVTRLKGRLTRSGDVKGLLSEFDDLFVIFGPGSEVLVDFDATKLPALPAGWTRGYVFRSWGYCKGSSLFTATGGAIEPLPFRGMTAFPYGAKEAYPRLQELKSSLRTTD
ncbi:MAG: CRTAC1 family protein, partial [Gemmataceae bacterium]|nr:CRTAC1 family protein [Gemmataceae bacterium]